MRLAVISLIYAGALILASANFIHAHLPRAISWVEIATR